MNSERESARYASIAMFAILVTAVFACAIVIDRSVPAAKALATGLTYYAFNEIHFLRSATPFDFINIDYHWEQAVLPSGGILTMLTPSRPGGGEAQLGFGYTFGKLGDIASISITGTGSYYLGIYFDMNNDGQFFSWNGNTRAGLGGDTYGLAYGLGRERTGSSTITPSDSFDLILDGNTYTIAQLQAGVSGGGVAGIDSNTIVGFWFGIIHVHGPETEQFEIDLINGLPVASLPVGGEWMPIGTFGMLARLAALFAVTAALTGSFVYVHRKRGARSN